MAGLTPHDYATIEIERWDQLASSAASRGNVHLANKYLNQYWAAVHELITSVEVHPESKKTSSDTLALQI